LLAAAELTAAVTDARATGATTLANPTVAVARDLDGRLHTFVTSTAGAVAHRWQVGAGSDTWTEWSTMDGSLTHIAAEAQADGRLEVWGTNSGDSVYRRTQTAPGSTNWTPWQLVDGSLRSIALARNSDGRLEVWGTNVGDSIYHRTQVAANANAWTPWELVPGSLRSVAAETNAEGRIEVFGTNVGRSLYRTSQTLPNTNTWSGWQLMDGSIGSVAAARSQDGRLELFGTTSTGQVVHRAQTGEMGLDNWWTWNSFPVSHETNAVAAERNLDGRIELIGTAWSGIANTAIFRRNQTTAGWTDWIKFDVAHNLAPALDKPQASGAAVVVRWTDRSDNEDRFDVFRRSGGQWQEVTRIPTRNKGLAGGTYTFTDNSPANGPQCYQVTATETGGFTSTSADLCVGEVGDEFGAIKPPAVAPLTTSQFTVGLNWTDRSDNEMQFRVQKRNLSGRWDDVHVIATDNSYASGDRYEWIDVETVVSGQCYRIGAGNLHNVAWSEETCAVRPDPDRFPQAVANQAEQWFGLPTTNHRQGHLKNIRAGGLGLHYQSTSGMDIDFGDAPFGNVTIRAEGGPRLMKGQAVALEIDGVPVKYGQQAFGIDLQFSGGPVYEWYVIGNASDPDSQTFAGQPLDWGNPVALWNSSAEAYLVYRHQVWGPDLDWYQVGGSIRTPPPPAEPLGIRVVKLFNCVGSPSFPSIDPPRPLSIWWRDVTAGAPFSGATKVQSNWSGVTCGTRVYNGEPFTFIAPNPAHTNHLFVFKAIDYTRPGCSDDPTMCVVSMYSIVLNPCLNADEDCRPGLTAHVVLPGGPITFP
jgi:hypothetical protein